MTVRCKMSLQIVNTGTRWSPEQGQEQKIFTLILRPVYSGSPENEAFFASTPNGQLELGTVNEEAAKQITEHRGKGGKGFGTFFVDIIPVDESAAP